MVQTTVEISTAATGICTPFARRYVRVFRVHTDDPLMNAPAALDTLMDATEPTNRVPSSCCGVPLRDLSAERDDNDPKIWIITYTYSTDPVMRTRHWDGQHWVVVSLPAEDPKDPDEPIIIEPDTERR